MSAPRFRQDHAVVIGASIAGALAARVLADHFAHVTLIERDRLPDAPEPRRGTPQDGHFHALLARGLAAIEQLFPGFEAELAARGAPGLDVGEDAAYVLTRGMAPRIRTGIRVRGASRQLIEWRIRRRLSAFGKVAIVEGRRVTGLVASRDGIAGVRVSNGDATETIGADLVVDASGRGSEAPKWLEAVGFPIPPERVAPSSAVYASRRFQRPAARQDWKALLIQADPGRNPRFGGILPEEDGRWVVALAGAAGTEPPTDGDGFLAFAKELASPLLFEAIRDAEPLGPVRGWRTTSSRVRRFDRLSLAPESFVVIGDAAAALNPVYGQGMSLAASGAALLGKALADGGNRAGLARRFHKRLADLVRIPFLLAAGQDARFGGEADWRTRLGAFHIGRLEARIPHDPELAMAFFRTLHLVDPAAFLRPRIVLRSLMPARTGSPDLSKAPALGRRQRSRS